MLSRPTDQGIRRSQCINGNDGHVSHVGHVVHIGLDGHDGHGGHEGHDGHDGHDGLDDQGSEKFKVSATLNVKKKKIAPESAKLFFYNLQQKCLF